MCPVDAFDKGAFAFAGIDAYTDMPIFSASGLNLQ